MLLKYFVDKTDSVLNEMCNGVIRFYPKVLKENNLDEIPEFNNLSLKTIADVKSIISIDQIFILGHSKDNFGYLGISGRCPWDPDHGYGVIMHKDRVVEVGNANIADSNYYILLEDKMTKEELKIHNKKIEEENTKYEIKQKENLRQELYDNKEIQLDEIDTGQNKLDLNNTKLFRFEDWNKIKKQNVEIGIDTFEIINDNQNEILEHELPNKNIVSSKKKWWKFWK